MTDIRKLTLLHSNDLHGRFLPEHKDGHEIGGISRLSGYVRKVRREEENVIYAVAGDMFRGSIIDSEYLGLSTIELMNILKPDVTTVGNHEVDYGIAHLLFLEKCARFPIINANLYVTISNTRLFKPYLNIETGGLRILFIGILTEEVLAAARTERVIGTYIDIEEAARQVSIICDNYRASDTDLTVLLTHIGIEKDRELAKLLDQGCGVDLIIGGHSHTFMDNMEVVNNISIAQAGWGTGLIGRFDLEYDKDARKLTRCDWEAVHIDERTCRKDRLMDDMIATYQSATDAKYKRLITRFARPLHHPSRTQETEMGNLYSDIMQDDSSFDIMMFGSGSIRKEVMGPIVEYQDMLENTPYDDKLWMLKVTGAQFRRMIQFIFRDEAWEGHTEFYQYSKGVRIVYRKSTHTIEELSFHGEPFEDDRFYLIALQNYHYNNFDQFFNVPLEEVKANMRPRVVATSVNNIIEEYLSVLPGLNARIEGRIVILE